MRVCVSENQHSYSIYIIRTEALQCRLSFSINLLLGLPCYQFFFIFCRITLYFLLPYIYIHTLTHAYVCVCVCVCVCKRIVVKIDKIVNDNGTNELTILMQQKGWNNSNTSIYVGEKDREWKRRERKDIHTFMYSWMNGNVRCKIKQKRLENIWKKNEKKEKKNVKKNWNKSKTK